MNIKNWKLLGVFLTRVPELWSILWYKRSWGYWSSGVKSFPKWLCYWSFIKTMDISGLFHFTCWNLFLLIFIKWTITSLPFSRLQINSTGKLLVSIETLSQILGLMDADWFERRGDGVIKWKFLAMAVTVSYAHKPTINMVQGNIFG